MELANLTFTAADVIIFKHYGLYHIAIEIPNRGLCISSHVRHTYKEALLALEESIVENNDAYGKLSIKPEAIDKVYANLDELKDYLTKDIESAAQLSA